MRLRGVRNLDEGVSVGRWFRGREYSLGGGAGSLGRLLGHALLDVVHRDRYGMCLIGCLKIGGKAGEIVLGPELRWLGNRSRWM